MREYGGEVNFICLEVQTLAKKRFSFKVFFIVPYSLFGNNSLYSRYLFVILAFSLMISFYLANEQKISLFKILVSDLRFIRPVF